MKRVIALSTLALLLLVMAAAPLAAQQPMPNWKAKSIELVADTKVGDTVLESGRYRIQHVMEDGKHILIFAKEISPKKELARVECTMEKLEKKAARDQQMFRIDGEQRVLSELIFRGDEVKHII